MFALSVSISTSGSPRFTSPPTSTSHLSTVPSSIESERRGIITSVALVLWCLEILEEGQAGLNHVLLVRERGLLERFGVRHWNICAGHPGHRRVKVVERLLLNQGREVCAHAAVRPALLDNHGAIRLLNGVKDRVEV